MDKVLFLITGGIGTGKTTFSYKLLDKIKSDFPEYINADIYYYLYFMNDNAPEPVNYEKAKAYMKHKLSRAIGEGKNIVWETVFAKDDKYEILKKFVESGYTIVTIYLYVSNAQELLERVKKRYYEGWYDIPETKILNRNEQIKQRLPLLEQLSDVLIAISTDNGYRLAIWNQKNKEHKL